MSSKILTGKRAYLISLPPSYSVDTNRQYPVIMILDAEDKPQFVAAIANLRFLNSRSEAPEMIVIGGVSGETRSQDLKPTVDSANKMAFTYKGGSSDFLKHISDELLPAIRSSYRTLPRTYLAGHSLGGLFAVYAAATRPDIFNGTIALSPSLWVHDSTVGDHAAALLQKQKLPVRHRMYLASGLYEIEIDVTAKKFVAALNQKRPADIDYRQQSYEDDHGTMPQRGFIDGLRFLFEPISFIDFDPTLDLKGMRDSARIAPRFPEKLRRYAEGARRLGLPETLPEFAVENEAFMMMRVSPAASLPIYSYMLENYPSSPFSHFGYADALLELKDSAKARAEYTRAAELARQQKNPYLADMEKKLKELGEKK